MEDDMVCKLTYDALEKMAGEQQQALSELTDVLFQIDTESRMAGSPPPCGPPTATLIQVRMLKERITELEAELKDEHDHALQQCELLQQRDKHIAELEAETTDLHTKMNTKYWEKIREDNTRYWELIKTKDRRIEELVTAISAAILDGATPAAMQKLQFAMGRTKARHPSRGTVVSCPCSVRFATRAQDGAAPTEAADKAIGKGNAAR